MKLGTPKRAWVILEEVTLPDGKKQLIPLAGTEDEKAINTALAAIKLYKDEKIKSVDVDLTDIRTSVVDKLNPVNQILDQDDGEEVVERLMSLVDEK
jgi:hypothetical protein